MSRYLANGRRLKELRGNKSIREVAEAVGVSPGSWCLYENGKRNPRDEVKIRIAKYFGKDVSAIFYP